VRRLAERVEPDHVYARRPSEAVARTGRFTAVDLNAAVLLPSDRLAWLWIASAAILGHLAATWISNVSSWL
jgi:hypothetical protein